MDNIDKQLSKLDDLFGQDEIYMWSTYILPNGHFLNPDNSDEYWEEIGEEPEYEHSDFIDNDYNPYGEDLFDDCIKMNVTYPYLILPENRPTPEQFRAIKNIINNKDGFHYALSDIEERVGRDLGNIQEPLLVQTPFADIVFDLSIVDAYDIVKDINKAYVTKTFLNEEYELSNEKDNLSHTLTKDQVEFFKNSKVRDKQGNLLVCYHGSDVSFDMFSKDRIRPGTFGNGFYFTTSKRSGTRYGEYVGEYYLNASNILVLPLDYEDVTEFVEKEYGVIVNSNKEATDVIISKGYDAITTPMYYGDDAFDYFVVFEPNQIKSIKNLHPTNSDNINEELLVEAKADTEKFKQWLINAVQENSKSKGYSQDKIESTITDLFNWFEQNRKNLKSPQNDYYYWIKKPSTQGIEELTDLTLQAESRQAQKKKEQEGAELIYKDNDWLVYYIKNYEASCKYGANTKWCITGTKRWSNGDGKTQWDRYAQQNIKMYFFIDRKNNTKYALALYPDKEFEIFDEEDLEISFIPNAPQIKEIGVNYWDKDDKRLLQYLFIENKLPKKLTFAVLSDIAVDCIGRGMDYAEVDITDDKNIACDWISETIPDNYIEHQAVEQGDMSAEEYESITDEPYDDFWGGDLPTMDWDVYSEIVGDSKSKEEACSVNNPFIKDNKYWQFVFGDTTQIYGFDSFEKLIRDGIYENYEDYYERDFKDFIAYCADETLRELQYNPQYIDDIVKLGVSKEYLLKEID